MQATLNPPSTTHLVGMGQIAIFAPPDLARAVLGSCVGVALFDEQTKLSALAHVVLPNSEGRSVATPGKFADTAVAALKQSLVEKGANPRRIQAKIAGGGNMFAGKGPFQIGTQNIEAVKTHLTAHSIRLVSEHVGGMHGRRVTLHPTTHRLVIEVAGQTAIEI